jgi:hypothetical protein
VNENLHDPKGCEHEWHPVSMRFETQLLDERGRVQIRQPDTEAGRVYLVCLRCSQHTYMETNWVGYRLNGVTDRGFDFNPQSSHPYLLDGGKTRLRELPDGWTPPSDEDPTDTSGETP